MLRGSTHCLAGFAGALRRGRWWACELREAGAWLEDEGAARELAAYSNKYAHVLRAELASSLKTQQQVPPVYQARARLGMPRDAYRFCSSIGERCGMSARALLDLADSCRPGRKHHMRRRLAVGIHHSSCPCKGRAWCRERLGLRALAGADLNPVWVAASAAEVGQEGRGVRANAAAGSARGGGQRDCTYQFQVVASARLGVQQPAAAAAAGEQRVREDGACMLANNIYAARQTESL